MMICGSCGMRMDGAAVLACKTRMYDIAQEGRVPVISAMGNLPIVKDLVVDMDPFWAKFKAMWPWLEPGFDRPDDGREYRISQERMNVDPEGVALHQLRLLRLGVQRDGVRPGVPRPAGAREGDALRRRPARRRDGRAARALQPGARHLGLHALLLLQRALPEGRRPARRDREARRRVDPARHRPRHGREAREVVRRVRRDDRLAARGGADPEDAGLRRPRSSSSSSAPASRATARCGRFPIPHTAKDVDEARNLRKLVSEQDRAGRARASSRASARSAKLEHGHADESLEEIYARPGAAPRPWLPEVEEEAKA